MKHYNKLKETIHIYIHKHYDVIEIDFDLFLLIAKSRVITKLKKKDLYIITDELKIEGSFEERETELESRLISDITYRKHKNQIKKIKVKNNLKSF